MRSAPSVVYPVGRCAIYGLVLLALGVAVLISIVSWGWTAPGFGSLTFWAVVFLALCWAGWTKRAWSSTLVGELHWDSLATPSDGSIRPGAWIWHPSHSESTQLLEEVVIVLDWQRGILLQLTERSGRKRWVWAEHFHDPDRWGDLRRALTSTGAR